MDQVPYSLDLLSGFRVDSFGRTAAQERFFKERDKTTKVLQGPNIRSWEDEKTTETEVEIQVSIGYVLETDSANPRYTLGVFPRMMEKPNAKLIPFLQLQKTPRPRMSKASRLRNLSQKESLQLSARTRRN